LAVIGIEQEGAGIMTPSDAQRRVLQLLDNANGQWVHMRWLDSTPSLHEDDFPVVPSLLENGWAAHRSRQVQITPEGSRVLNERASRPGGHAPTKKAGLSPPDP
jgi:hypothetical protein